MPKGIKTSKWKISYYFSKKNKNIPSIEKKIDTILENKQREKLDIERFSMKNKQGEFLYFIKEKTKKKQTNEQDKFLSHEIIQEARYNLGEEPLDFKQKRETDETKKQIKIGVKKTGSKGDSQPTEEIISEIDEELKKKEIEDAKKINKPDKDAELLDKILKEEKTTNKKESFFRKKAKTSEDSEKNEERALESKARELAEKHEIFNNKKQKSDISVKKEQPAFSEINLSKTDEIKTDETKFLDQKISENHIDLKKEHKSEIKEKKSFFKKEKIEPPIKELKKEGSGSSDYTSEFKFKVENLPKSTILNKDEAKLIDEKISRSPVKKNKNDNDKKVEEKALKLAEEHIKDKTTDDVKDSLNKSKDDVNLKPLEITPAADDEEHVFFDESEESFDGWTPQITESDRKTLKTVPSTSSDLGANEELKYDKDIELPKDILQNKSVKLVDLGFSEHEWEELDFYSLYEPFAYVEILRERETLDKCYFLVEVELTPEEQQQLNFIVETMGSLSINADEMEEKGDDAYLSERINEVISEYNLQISEASRNKIQYYIEKKSLGLGKIAPLLKDPNIEDISCDGASVPLFLYHRKFGSLRSNIKFDDEEELSGFVFRLAQKCGKQISIAEPMLDATMPDGSRVQMTLSDEITAKGSTFTIRKFREDPFSPPDLVEFNTMSSEMIAYFWLAVENGVNTLFAGGTASGKTTALNALSLFIPRESKIVSIEETREINLPHPNWIPGVARSGFGEVVADKMVGEIDLYDLMKAALRQRPEYILVGEIRGREAYVLFQAMATGHATYSTVHADSAQSLIHRLEGKPINIPRVMLQSLDVVSLHVITRVKNNRARRCKQVIEIIDIDPTTKEILTNEVFRWDPVEDRFIYSGKSYVLEKIRAEKDMSREQMTEELKRRKKIVEWMNNTNIREFRDVAQLVARYSESPEEVLKNVNKETK